MAMERRTAARPVKRGSKISEAIAKDILGRIRKDRLAQGAQLPSEAQMAAEYDVGRASLREALRILEIHGVIKIKAGPGGGPVVSTLTTADFGRMATLFFEAGSMTFRELIDARLAMEPLMARLAAERRDPKFVDELLACSTEMESDEAYLRSSEKFHRLVASMSGNGMLNLFSHSLEDIFHERVSGLLFPMSRRREVVAAHAAIAKAISRGKAAEAEDLMRQHMEEYARYVLKRHPGLSNEVVAWM